ncbi:hypothetical protein Tco_1523245 [Tanacetum coccineum]
MVKFIFHLLDLSWAKEFHQDRASSVKVPVANFTLQSSVQLLRENTNSVRSNQQIRASLGLVVLSVFAMLAACASRARKLLHQQLVLEMASLKKKEFLRITHICDSIEDRGTIVGSGIDSEHYTVTYTSVSEDDSDIGSPGVDGPPIMPEDPYAYIMAAYEGFHISLTNIPGPEGTTITRLQYLAQRSQEQATHPPPVLFYTLVLSSQDSITCFPTSPTAESPRYIPESDPEEDPRGSS